MLKRFLWELYWLIDRSYSFLVTIVVLFIAAFVAAMIFTPHFREILWLIKIVSAPGAFFGSALGAVIGTGLAIRSMFQHKSNFTVRKYCGIVVSVSLAGAALVIVVISGAGVLVVSLAWLIITLHWQGCLVFIGSLFILFALFPLAYEKRMGWE
jgi:hypothetical protein